MNMDKTKEILTWLHIHNVTYEILMEDLDGDRYMGYKDRKAADVTDSLRQIFDNKKLKYTGAQVLSALRYERQNPNVVGEIEKYIDYNNIERVFP